MTYFVITMLQQRDGAIGKTMTDFNDLHNAKMEFHSQLASIYIPSNRANNKWATCVLIRQDGIVVNYQTDSFDTDE